MLQARRTTSPCWTTSQSAHKNNLKNTTHHEINWPSTSEFPSEILSPVNLPPYRVKYANTEITRPMSLQHKEQTADIEMLYSYERSKYQINYLYGIY
jgi:hypothetical protein